MESRLFEHFFGRDDLDSDSRKPFGPPIYAREDDPYMIADLMLAEKGIS